MQKFHSWRSLLATLTQRSREKQRIINELGLSPETLQHWIRGEVTPRREDFYSLLMVFPEQRKRLLDLLPTELKAHLYDIGYEEQAIPSAFYDRVMEAHTTLSPSIRFPTTSDLISRQALEQLDPYRVGMEITIVECTPPSHRGKIRSLSKKLSMRTFPEQRIQDQRYMFLGTESFAGNVVAKGNVHIVRSRQEGQQLFPVHWRHFEESVIGYPLLQADMIAGCLLFTSILPDYFLPSFRQVLVKKYAHLLTSMFPQERFYERSMIDLYLMPTYDGQRPFIATRQQRVSLIMAQGIKDQHVPFLEAERIVQHQIEQELLQLALWGVNMLADKQSSSA